VKKKNLFFAQKPNIKMNKHVNKVRKATGSLFWKHRQLHQSKITISNNSKTSWFSTEITKKTKCCISKSACVQKYLSIKHTENISICNREASTCRDVDQNVHISTHPLRMLILFDVELWYLASTRTLSAANTHKHWGGVGDNFLCLLFL